MDDNEITTIPSDIINLENLEYLYLNNNCLTTIPSELAYLEELRILCLAHNELTNIPGEIAEMWDLMLVDLESNKLSCLPQFLFNLPPTTHFVVQVSIFEQIDWESIGVDINETRVPDCDTSMADWGNIKKLLKWNYAHHKHSSNSTKIVIETILILNLKD